MDLCYSTHPLAVRMDRPLGVPEPPPARDVVEAARTRRKAQRLAKINVPLALEVTSQGHQWGQAFVRLQDRHEARVAARAAAAEDHPAAIARRIRQRARQQRMVTR